MVRINMKDTGDGAGSKPGIYLARIQKFEERTSNNGNNMLNVTLVHDHGRAMLCYDNIMLEGKGWFIGRAKLIALGMAEDFEGELDTDFIRNARVWVAVKQGDKYLEVDIDQLKHKGYQYVGDTPAGCDPAPEDVGDAPF